MSWGAAASLQAHALISLTAIALAVLQGHSTHSAVVALLLCTSYALRFISCTGMYRSIMSWQLTIWSIHAGPLVALRLLELPPAAERLACVTWMTGSLATRCNSSFSVFSLALTALEAAVVCHEVKLRLEPSTV